jgi:hypothetical protein
MLKHLTAALAALALVCLAPLAVHAQVAPFIADSTLAGINISTATTTKIVSNAPNKKTLVNIAFLYGPHTNNVTFEYGTGSNCGTGTTAIGGIIELSASTPGFTLGNGTGAVLTIPADKDLCILTTGNVQLSGWLQYNQYALP